MTKLFTLKGYNIWIGKDGCFHLTFEGRPQPSDTSGGYYRLSSLLALKGL